MADLTFKDLLVGVLIVGLFFFAVIMFNVRLAAENNVNSSLMQDSFINSSFINISTQLGRVQAEAETQRETWYQNIPVVGEISVIMETIVSVGKSVIDINTGLVSILIRVIGTTLGLGEGEAKVVFGVVIAIVIIMSILLAWSVYRSGK